MHIAPWGALAMTAHSSQGNRKDMHFPYMGSISATRIGVHVAQAFVERIQVPRMSDRDRGRGHGGFHGGVRPPRGVPAYGYIQSNGNTTYIDRAGPPGPASMVADGVLSSQRHSTDNGHGQWDQQVSFLQRGRYGPPVVPTPPARHINFGIGPPPGNDAMAYPYDNMRHPQYPTPLGMGLNVHLAQHQRAFHQTTPHIQHGHHGPVSTGERPAPPPPPAENAWLLFQQRQYLYDTPPMRHDSQMLARAQLAQHGSEAWYGVQPPLAEAPYFGRGEQSQADLQQSPIRHDQRHEQPAKGKDEGSFLAQLQALMNPNQLTNWYRTASAEHLARLTSEGNNDPKTFGISMASVPQESDDTTASNYDKQPMAPPSIKDPAGIKTGGAHAGAKGQFALPDGEEDQQAYHSSASIIANTHRTTALRQKFARQRQAATLLAAKARRMRMQRHTSGLLRRCATAVKRRTSSTNAEWQQPR